MDPNIKKINKICAMLHDARDLVMQLYEEFADIDEYDAPSTALHAMWSLEEMNKYLAEMTNDRRADSAHGLVAKVYKHFSKSKGRGKDTKR
jgi:hypothetical protein